MVISKKIIKPHHPPIYMNDAIIREVEQHKHLGVIFQDDGCSNSHIDYIIFNLSLRYIGMLSQTISAYSRIGLTQLKYMICNNSRESLNLSLRMRFKRGVAHGKNSTMVSPMAC
jgi:hypothetical protein